jgi:hypothetical protein
MARRDDRGGEHGVEVFGLVLAALTMGTVRAMDFLLTHFPQPPYHGTYREHMV